MTVKSTIVDLARRAFSSQQSAARAVQGGEMEVREAIAAKKAERAQLVTQPVPKADALAALDVGLARMAEPGVAALPLASLTRPERTPSFDPQMSADLVLPLLVALMGDELRAVMVRRLDDFYAGRPEIDAAAKAARIAALDGEIFELEMAEEAMVRDAQAAGLMFDRRADADPRAVLAAIESSAMP